MLAESMTSVKWLHNPRIDRYQAESMVRLLTDTADPRVEINKPFDGRKKKWKTRCERRGQLEIGVVTHEGHVFAAFGASVYQRNVTGYTRQRNGSISLSRWDGTTMMDCRNEVIRQFHDGSIAMIFRLTHGRFIVGYALGADAMLFRGELLSDCDFDRARHEAFTLADYWSGIDTEDESDPWHGEPGEPDDGE
jgi:hypothetical protein